MGTYTVTDFVPAFTVNGSRRGPITAVTNQNPDRLEQLAARRDVICGGYQYSLCLAPAADNYVLWGSMARPSAERHTSTSATIPVPATAGSYALKIRVNYTGGTASGPIRRAAPALHRERGDRAPLAVTVTVNPTSRTVDQTA